jgi:hypothetical protein
MEMIRIEVEICVEMEIIWVEVETICVEMEVIGMCLCSIASHPQVYMYSAPEDYNLSSPP